MPAGSPSSAPSPAPSSAAPKRRTPLRRIVLWCAALTGAGVASGVLAVGIAVALVSPTLPDVSALADYRPKLPLRVYTADGVRIGEFGQERRELVSLDAVPQRLKDAVLAAEDARFYAHEGVDVRGVLRAVLANLTGRRQGASTITMQVARNVYLSPEQTLARKFSEVLLALRMEARLSKDQILEIYLNQIYLGHRSYGFAAASQTYFGKPLPQLSLAEAAMLAGLPKAPSSANPLTNPRRAAARQHYVIERMQHAGFISADEAAAARQAPLQLRNAVAEANEAPRLHAGHVAEAVRRQVVAQYGEGAYTRGLAVYTTLVAAEQEAAGRALRRTLLDYERRQPWRGPEAFVALPVDADVDARDDAVDAALAAHPDSDPLVAAVVLEADAKQVTAVRADGQTLRITGAGLRPARAGLAPGADAALRIRRGAVIRAMRTGEGTAEGAWTIAQMPEVEAAFVALDPRDGAVRALVGGFDFGRNQFDHATQAWRQPGSSFKPFIYSAALEKGYTPATVVDDAPLYFDGPAMGGAPWTPKNYDGRYDGPMSLREALARSKNTATIRLLETVGPREAQDWIGRFGFTRERHPAYLSMALGAGAVTPMQMATAYAVFANGGHRVNPTLVARITDTEGRVLFEAPPTVQGEATRAIPARNAFVTGTLLHSVVAQGTGRRAGTALRRDDLYGKTGTTNDSFDAWFAGFQPTRVGVAWVGYDTPRQLGVRGETGGSMALPIWTGYMRTALQGVPVARLALPEGVAEVDGEWYYDEFTPGRGIATLGAPDAADPQALLAEDVPEGVWTRERGRILGFFR